MIQSLYNDQSATARTPLRVLALADRRPKIDIIQTVRDRQIDLIITLGDFDRSDLLALAYITDIAGNICKRWASLICTARFGSTED